MGPRGVSAKPMRPIPSGVRLPGQRVERCPPRQQRGQGSPRPRRMAPCAGVGRHVDGERFRLGGGTLRLKMVGLGTFAWTTISYLLDGTSRSQLSHTSAPQARDETSRAFRARIMPAVRGGSSHPSTRMRGQKTLPVLPHRANHAKVTRHPTRRRRGRTGVLRVLDGQEEQSYGRVSWPG